MLVRKTVKVFKKFQLEKMPFTGSVNFEVLHLQCLFCPEGLIVPAECFL
jgi:hypothetical protein